MQAHIDNGPGTVDRTGEKVPRLGLASQPLAVGTLRLEFFGESDDGEALYTTEIEGHVLVEGQGAGSKAVQTISVDPIREDVLVQEYAYLTLVVTVVMDEAASKLSGSQYALEYNMNGPGCACAEHHPGRVVQADENSRQRRDGRQPDLKRVSSATPPEPTQWIRGNFGAHAEIQCAPRPRGARSVHSAHRCNADAEYVVDEGSLERDRSRAAPVCLDEYAHRPATASTARECRALVECTDLGRSSRRATQSATLSARAWAVRRRKRTGTSTKLCATKTDCAPKPARGAARGLCRRRVHRVRGGVRRGSVHRDRAHADGRGVGKSYTSAGHRFLRDAAVSSDRTCKPLRDASRARFTGPRLVEEDAVYTPIVRFSLGGSRRA